VKNAEYYQYRHACLLSNVSTRNLLREQRTKVLYTVLLHVRSHVLVRIMIILHVLGDQTPRAYLCGPCSVHNDKAEQTPIKVAGVPGERRIRNLAVQKTNAIG
jgi:hypothetical protein